MSAFVNLLLFYSYSVHSFAFISPLKNFIMTTIKKEVVTLPNGMTCYPEYEKQALQIFENAYNRAFDGGNYEYANACTDLALYNFLKD